jgi:hypothetical protein
MNLDAKYISVQFAPFEPETCIESFSNNGGIIIGKTRNSWRSTNYMIRDV